MKKDKIRIIAICLGIFLLAIPLDTVQIVKEISVLRIFAIIPIFVSLFYKKDFKINKSIVYLFIFVFYLIIQIFYSKNATATINKTITFAMYFVMIFLCTTITYNKKEKRFLEILFACSTILTIILLIFFGIYEEGRLTFKIGNNSPEDENQLCGYFIAGIIYFMSIYQPKKKIISITFIFVAFAFALLTGSRGGILAITIAIATYLMCYSNDKRIMLKKILVAILIGVILLISIKYLFSLMSPEIAKRFTVQSIIETGGTGRTKIWNNYLNIYKEASLKNKIFGFGIGAITSSFDKVAHNNWVELLVETGCLGVFIYFVFIVSLLKNSYKNKNIYLFSVLIGYVGLTISLSLFSYKPIWGVIVLVLLKCKEDEDVDYKRTEQNKHKDTLNN